jgi:ATP-binding cassette subfamily B protein
MEYKLEKIKQDKASKGLGLIARYFIPHYKKLLTVLFLLAVATLSGLFIPLLVQHVKDVNLAGENPDAEGLKQTVFLAAALSLVSIITRYFQMRMIGLLSQSSLYEIRKDVFSKMQSLPLRFFSENNSGDIINRVTSNVESINAFLSEGMMRTLGLSFQVLGIVLILFTVHGQLALFSFLTIIAVFLILIVQGNLLRRVLRRSLDLDGQVSDQIQETLNGFKIVKIYGQEKKILNRFKSKNSDYFKYAMLGSFINSLSQPLIIVVTSIINLILIVLSLNLLRTGELSAGAVVSFGLYLGILFRPLSNITGLWKTIQNGISSAQRIREIIDLESNIKECEDCYSPSVQEIKGRVEFKDVDFSYEDEDLVLKDINFKVDPGETIAIVGPTGAGKTTFVNLIARLYDVKSGAVLVDGRDVKTWSLSTLRSQVGYLLQDTFLFDDSIINNIRYDNSGITKEEVMALFKELGAEAFIKGLAGGLETKLENGGQNLSAGQQQLIAIVRLILRKPKILILDEATSNIDTKTERDIQKAIDLAASQTTTFIIAHRLSTIKNADRIILVQDNTILESGSHKELMKSKGKYFEMYQKFQGK